MNPRTLVALTVVALLAIVAWPAFMTMRGTALAARPSPAPVTADYLHRDAIVAVYERDARSHPDQIITRMLASQYLMRYRETGDVGDLLRAQRAAHASLAVQPHNNIGADMALASALQSLHQFNAALSYAREAIVIEPWSNTAIAQAAGIQTELGHYAAADELLRSARPGPRNDAALDTAQARYDELSGQIAHARRLIERSMVSADSMVDSPAETRAWFHFRAGELAWASGDAATAEQRYREALQIFPRYARAYNGLARMYWGQKHWSEARDAAAHAADLIPLPETLGYEADAQRALGDARGARVTEDTIVAIERIGNAYKINDRALAIYYAEHHMRPADALAIARRDVAVRDDVFAEDTLAWAFAQAGQWREAQIHADKAVALNTEDARLQYHAGVIALHNGRTAEAAARLRHALDINAQFHPAYADDARRLLAHM
jgi:tetratricopeptide (TPR) repeat protein